MLSARTIQKAYRRYKRGQGEGVNEVKRRLAAIRIQRWARSNPFHHRLSLLKRAQLLTSRLTSKSLLLPLSTYTQLSPGPFSHLSPFADPFQALHQGTLCRI
jgi:hypothetical protein